MFLFFIGLLTSMMTGVTVFSTIFITAIANLVNEFILPIGLVVTGAFIATFIIVTLAVFFPLLLFGAFTGLVLTRWYRFTVLPSVALLNMANPLTTAITTTIPNYPHRPVSPTPTLLHPPAHLQVVSGALLPLLSSSSLDAP